MNTNAASEAGSWESAPALEQSARGKRRWDRCLCGKVELRLAVDMIAGSNPAVVEGRKETGGAVGGRTHSAETLATSMLADLGWVAVS